MLLAACSFPRDFPIRLAPGNTDPLCVCVCVYFPTYGCACLRLSVSPRLTGMNSSNPSPGAPWLRRDHKPPLATSAHSTPNGSASQTGRGPPPTPVRMRVCCICVHVCTAVRDLQCAWLHTLYITCAENISRGAMTRQTTMQACQSY